MTSISSRRPQSNRFSSSRPDISAAKIPRLHTDEILIALSATAADSEDAKLALAQLPKLHKCQVHSSVMLSEVDRKTFQRLGCDVTCEPKF